MKKLFKNLKFAWKYFKGQRFKVFVYIICNVFVAVLGIFIPILSAKVITLLTNNKIKQLIYMGFVLLLFELAKHIISSIISYCTQSVYNKTQNVVQMEIGKEMLKLENKTLDKNSSGVFIQRLTGDSRNIASIFHMLSSEISQLIGDFGIYIAALYIDFWVFVYFVIVSFTLTMISNIQNKKYEENDRKSMEEQEKVTGLTSELVSGVRDIKMLNAEESFLKIFNNKINGLNNMRFKTSNIFRKYSTLFDCSIDLFTYGLILIFAYQLTHNTLSVALALALYNYFDYVCVLAMHFDGISRNVREFNLSAERVFAIINSDEFTKEKFGNTHLDKVEGNFEFKNVSFAYKDNKVLDNLSFKINANETTAFVGKSGAGKSTIFSLLDKMYNVDSGEILIDGVNINELDKDSIRSNITIISQNPYIFNLSIRDNLKLVKEDLTDEEMVKACKVACLDEFIDSLPNKYDTILGENGVNLSGGQRQRLAIARALVQKTEIILFDEATSSLDNETQYEIQKAINNMQGEYTILIIAHRLSTIIDSDRILFLNDGHIEAEGTHEELLKNNEDYKHLYEAELK